MTLSPALLWLPAPAKRQNQDRLVLNAAVSSAAPTSVMVTPLMLRQTAPPKVKILPKAPIKKRVVSVQGFRNLSNVLRLSGKRDLP
jgi:hypothetical protein